MAIKLKELSRRSIFSIDVVFAKDDRISKLNKLYSVLVSQLKHDESFLISFANCFNVLHLIELIKDMNFYIIFMTSILFDKYSFF